MVPAEITAGAALYGRCAPRVHQHAALTVNRQGQFATPRLISVQAFAGRCMSACRPRTRGGSTDESAAKIERTSVIDLRQLPELPRFCQLPGDRSRGGSERLDSLAATVATSASSSARRFLRAPRRFTILSAAAASSGRRCSALRERFGDRIRRVIALLIAGVPRCWIEAIVERKNADRQMQVDFPSADAGSAAKLAPGAGAIHLRPAAAAAES